MADNPAVSGASATVLGQVGVVVGAVAVTFVAGLAFAWLRLRSGSLVAPVWRTSPPTASPSPSPGRRCTGHSRSDT